MTSTRSKSMIFRVVALLIIFLAGTFHSLSDPVSRAESIADGGRCSCNLTPVRLQGSLILQLSRNFNGTGSLGSRLFFFSPRMDWGKGSEKPLQSSRGLAIRFRGFSASPSQPLLGSSRNAPPH